MILLYKPFLCFRGTQPIFALGQNFKELFVGGGCSGVLGVVLVFWGVGCVNLTSTLKISLSINLESEIQGRFFVVHISSTMNFL